MADDGSARYGLAAAGSLPALPEQRGLAGTLVEEADGRGGGAYRDHGEPQRAAVRAVSAVLGRDRGWGCGNGIQQRIDETGRGRRPLSRRPLSLSSPQPSASAPAISEQTRRTDTNARRVHSITCPRELGADAPRPFRASVPVLPPRASGILTLLHDATGDQSVKAAAVSLPPGPDGRISIVISHWAS